MRWSSQVRARSRTTRRCCRPSQFQSTSDNPTDFNASPQRTLTWSVFDGTAITTATTTVDITAVNDAPINTVPGAQSVAEDTILPIAGVSVADSDSSALTTTLSVSSGTLTVIAGSGVTGNGTASVTITGTAAQINAALAGLAYTGNLNFNGGDTLTVATNDGTATDTDTVAITVNAVNDAPINTVPGAQSVAEDTALPIAGVSVADIDSSALTTTLNVSSGILNVTAGAGVTGNGSASVTITGTAAQINAALAGLAYTGNLNFNGGDTLTVATSDGTATDTDMIAITVNPVNDAPVNTVPGAQSVAEDTTLPIAGVSVADIDSSALTTTLNVSSGTLNVTARRRRQRQRQRQRNHHRHGSADQRGAGGPRLYRQPQLQRRRHAHGRDQRRDRHRHRHGRDHCQCSERPPGQYRAGRAERRRGHHPADRRRLGGGHRQQRAHHHANVSSGILNVIAGAGVTGNGSASVTITGTAAQINTALAGLAYTGNPDFNGVDTLTVVTSDGTATDTDTIAITVNPVNDAPVNTVPGAQSVAEDTALPIAGVSVADIDSSALTTTLSVANGILNVTAGAGVTGNGSASVTITGTAAEINAALAGLTYTGSLRLQRRRHAHGRDQRRDRHRHRHDRDHCQSSERRARARRCGRNLPGGCPGIAFAISQPHRRGRHRARLRRRADHRRVVSRRRRQPDRQRRHQRHADWHHVPLGPHTACVGLHRCEFGRELPGAAADGPISIDEPQSHRLRQRVRNGP